MIITLLLALTAMAVAADTDERKVRRSVVLEAVLGSRVLLSVDGQREMLGVAQAGTSGVEVLRIEPDAAQVRVDGEVRQLRLGDHDVATVPYKERQTFIVTIPQDAHGMYSTIGSINGLPVKFLVDTGATTIAMNSGQARRLAIDYRVKGQKTLVNTAGGVTPAYLVTLDKVAVGEISMNNIAAVVLDGPHPPQVLLGMTFLGQLQIQREGALMRLEKRR